MSGGSRRPEHSERARVERRDLRPARLDPVALARSALFGDDPAADERPASTDHDVAQSASLLLDDDARAAGPGAVAGAPAVDPLTGPSPSAAELVAAREAAAAAHRRCLELAAGLTAAHEARRAADAAATDAEDRARRLTEALTEAELRLTEADESRARAEERVREAEDGTASALRGRRAADEAAARAATERERLELAVAQHADQAERSARRQAEAEARAAALAVELEDARAALRRATSPDRRPPDVGSAAATTDRPREAPTRSVDDPSAPGAWPAPRRPDAPGLPIAPSAVAGSVVPARRPTPPARASEPIDWQAGLDPVLGRRPGPRSPTASDAPLGRAGRGMRAGAPNPQVDPDAVVVAGAAIPDAQQPPAGRARSTGQHARRAVSDGGGTRVDRDARVDRVDRVDLHRPVDVRGLLLLVSVALGLGAVTYLAVVGSLASAAAVAALAIAVASAGLWIRLRRERPRLWLEGDVLHVVTKSARRGFDLSSPHTRIQVHGEPGERGWRVHFLRRSLPAFVIDPTMVDPYELTEKIRERRSDV